MADSANGGEEVKNPVGAHATAAAPTPSGTAAAEAAPPREASPAAAAAAAPAATDNTATAPSEQGERETRLLPLELKLASFNPLVG